MALFLLLGSTAGAYAACCSGHGGVASCNSTTGYKMCKDGTVSPTCTCPKVKAKAKANTNANANANAKANAVKSTTVTTESDSKKSSWWNKATEKKPYSRTVSSPKTSYQSRGCCSRHGGIAQCDKRTHHQVCRDGTQSPSCLCQ